MEDVPAHQAGGVVGLGPGDVFADELVGAVGFQAGLGTCPADAAGSCGMSGA
jgi:hypothetical protein